MKGEKIKDEGSLILPGFRLRRHPLPLAAGPCKAGKATGWPKGHPDCFRFMTSSKQAWLPPETKNNRTQKRPAAFPSSGG